MVDFSFFTKGAFRYRFGIGRTNSAGQLTVSYHDVEMIRTQNAQFDLMDYNTRLEECDAAIEITIDSGDQLRERYENVRRVYRRSPDWAENWPANASVQPYQKRVAVAGPLTEVKIQIQPTVNLESWESW